MRFPQLLAGAVIVTGWVVAAEAGQLAPPVHVMADGQALDVGGVGYAAPFLADYDGNGTRDLLVGQFHEGRLRIYRNLGTDSEPRFGQYEWFRDGAETGRVPTG
jgi:hypothetical protein